MEHVSVSEAVQVADSIRDRINDLEAQLGFSRALVGDKSDPELTAIYEEEEAEHLAEIERLRNLLEEWEEATYESEDWDAIED